MFQLFLCNCTNSSPLKLILSLITRLLPPICSKYVIYGRWALIQPNNFCEYSQCRIQINQFDWMKTNSCFLYVYFSLYKFINLLVKNSIVKIWIIWKFEERATHMLFCGKFLPKFLPYFFLLRIVVLELSACFKSVIVYTYLKVKWGSTPCFLS